MAKGWLGEYLAAATAKDLCTRPYCTTCGALEFRLGLLENLRGQQPKTYALDKNLGNELLEELASLERNDQHPAGVMLILFDLWSRIPMSEADMAARLSGTWAGEILESMKRHEVRLKAARAAQADEQVQARGRKAERKHRLHQERLAKQAERSRRWHQDHDK